MAEFVKRSRAFILFFLTACVVSGAGVVFVGHATFKQIIATDGVERAQWMAQGITRSQLVYDTMLLKGRREDLLRAGSFYKDRWFYDEKGALISSVHSGENEMLHEAFNKRNVFAALDVLGSSEPIFETVTSNDEVLSRTFVPLQDKEGNFGVLEVIADETTNWQVLFEQFYMTSLKMITLIIVAFAPAFYVYQRGLSKWKNSVSTLADKQQYDRLTLALTRTAFLDFLAKAQPKLNVEKAGARLIILDLDRFKAVNESRGQIFGDELLSQVAKRIRFLLGPQEKIARLGSDEFAIYQKIGTEKNAKKGVSIAQIIEELSKPFTIVDTDLEIDFSIGHAIYPRDGVELTDVLRSADVAIGHAKKQTGRSSVEYKYGMKSTQDERSRIEYRLRQALANNDFELHYQPQYDVAGLNVAGFEALLRLKDVRGTPISPAIFIPIAEEIGLISEIGEWVLREAVTQVKKWPESIYVAVNLSPTQFKTQDLPRLVKSVCAEANVAPNRIELEVTEGLLIEDTFKVLNTLKSLKKVGVSLALDDFGTGFSSLSYLWQFPFDKLKIDKSFINDLTEGNVKARSILCSIVSMGDALGLTVTAEGVETEAQAEVLKEINCDLIQGYLYGRALHPLDATALLDLHEESVGHRRRHDDYKVIKLVSRHTK